MLTLVDELLRTLLMETLVRVQSPPPAPPVTVTDQQVRFDPPDDLWRAYVNTTLVASAFNAYLADARENRKLRSLERVRDIENGVVIEQPAPARLDCHYLITAWTPSPAAVSPAHEPTLDEHALLYGAVSTFLDNAPLRPSRVHPPNSQALDDWPERYRDIDLPVVVAPVEGFPKLAEFWGTMGQNHPWKPVLYLIVTVPIEIARRVAGPMVTTRITEYRQAGRLDIVEEWIEIGGHVLVKGTGTNPPLPVAAARVQLETVSNEVLRTAETDEQGRFTFAGLRSGRYQLRVRAVGLTDQDPQIVDVPSPGGTYDVMFS